MREFNASFQNHHTSRDSIIRLSDLLEYQLQLTFSYALEYSKKPIHVSTSIIFKSSHHTYKNFFFTSQNKSKIAMKKKKYKNRSDNHQNPPRTSVLRQPIKGRDHHHFLYNQICFQTQSPSLRKVRKQKRLHSRVSRLDSSSRLESVALVENTEEGRLLKK